MTLLCLLCCLSCCDPTSKTVLSCLFFFLFDTSTIVIFNIYDLDGDETISKEEMFSLLKMMVGSEVTEETLAQIAERAVFEGDDDKDGFISFEDFKKVSKNCGNIFEHASLEFISRGYSCRGCHQYHSLILLSCYLSFKMCFSISV